MGPSLLPALSMFASISAILWFCDYDSLGAAECKQPMIEAEELTEAAEETGWNK